MKLMIISGSHRDNSQSLKLAQEILKLDLLKINFNSKSLLNINSLSIPFWDEGVWNNDPKWNIWVKLKEELKEVDAFIIISPEWGGMVPPGLKNLLLLSGPEELGHKPALIISISAGQGGTNPVHELRSTGYKNNHICFIPDHIIFRNLGEDNKSIIDSKKLEILNYHTSLLSEYSRALASIRNNNVIDTENFKYGMS